MKNILSILAIVILLIGCKTKQVTVTEKEFVYDTIYKASEVIIIPPITNTIEIESPCDSITGELKPFRQVLSTGVVDVTIESKNGVLIAEINTDSIKQIAVKEYISKNSEKSFVKETIIKKRKPCWWLIIYAIIITIYAFRKQIINIVGYFYPPLKAMKFFTKFFN